MNSSSNRENDAQSVEALLNTNPWDHREGGVTLDLLDLTYNGLRLALGTGVNDDHYVICTEGVGWVVREDKPLDFYDSAAGSVHRPLTVPELRDFRTGETADLADFIRTFGDRLQSNFWFWWRLLTTEDVDNESHHGSAVPLDEPECDGCDQDPFAAEAHYGSCPLKPREDADGAPFLSYYRPDELLSFSWSGDFNRPVEVSHGGAGEPVVAGFSVSPSTFSRLSLASVLSVFQRLCDAWTETAWQLPEGN